MNWWEQPVVWVAVIGLIGTALGIFVKYRSDNSASKTTAHVSREQRIDDKIDRYTDRIEERLTQVEQDAEEAKTKAEELSRKVEILEQEKKVLEGKVESLEIERSLADARELLLYRHTKALRDHILNELPPPPPTAPQELIDWFANFEDTDSGLIRIPPKR
jgi:hypothetical protein